MAMTGVLRPGFIQLRVLDMDEAVTHYVDRLGMIEACRGDDGRVYLKTYDEFDHHSVVLREADRAGMDVFAFQNRIVCQTVTVGTGMFVSIQQIFPQFPVFQRALLIVHTRN